MGIGWVLHAPQWSDKHTWASLLFVWLYYALMESSPLQATLGKICMSYRVTDLKGARISFLRATGRHFAVAVSVLPCFLGLALVLITPRKQALHDIIAGCIHVHR